MLNKETETTRTARLFSWFLLIPQYAYVYYCLTEMEYTTYTSSVLRVHTMYLDIFGFFWILFTAFVLSHTALNLFKLIMNDNTISYMNLIIIGFLTCAIIRHGRSQPAPWNPFAAKNQIPSLKEIANVPLFFRDIESTVCGNLKRVVGQPGLLITRLGTGCATRATINM